LIAFSLFSYGSSEEKNIATINSLFYVRALFKKIVHILLRLSEEMTMIVRYNLVKVRKQEGEAYAEEFSA